MGTELRILTPDVSDEEVAAVVIALATRRTDVRPAPAATGTPSRWADPTHAMRRGLPSRWA
ncbi:MAG: acyl-CoA carboxylase subunit epsilon [Nocardioides sp.]